MANVPVTVFGQTLSCKGPLIIPKTIDFRTALTAIVDLSSQVQQNTIDFINSVYVDNKDGPYNIDIVASSTYSRITVPAKSQCFFPLLATNPPVFTLTCSGVQGIQIQFYFGNIPWVPFRNQF